MAVSIVIALNNPSSVPAAIEDVANQFQGVHISAAVGMPDQYAGEVPALFVIAVPGADIDLRALGAYMETNVHEAPARPKIVKVIREIAPESAIFGSRPP